MSPQLESVRRAAVAGMFYPGSTEDLGGEVDLLLTKAPVAVLPGEPVALVAPHAGYAYSGPTAAAAYTLIKGMKVSTVVVVSPSHREYFPGVSVYPGTAYETPLGLIPVDVAMRDRLLAASALVRSTRSGHGTEHALEVHLPFLQKVLGEFRLLPLVMGDQSRDTCYGLGEVLGMLLQGESCLLVASTDLSHFHPAVEAERRDGIVLKDLESFEPGRLMDDLENDKAEACGGGPVVAVMIAAQALGARRLKVLAHTHSGTVNYDTQSVVGYCAAVMTR
jgi:MEMO1 family protein